VLKYRLITGPLLVIVLLAIVAVDDRLDTVRLTGVWHELFTGRDHPPRGLLLFFVGQVVVALAAIELSRIFRACGITTRTWLTALAAMIGLFLSYSIPTRTAASEGTDATTTVAIVASGMIVVFLAALITFSRDRRVEGVIAAAGAVMFAMVYLGFMAGFLLALRRSHSAWWIVGVILSTKACDIAAYFTGRAVGRHKLIVWLSPGKTWEGLAGGILFAGLVGLLLALASGWLDESDHVPAWLGLLCGLAFAVVGQLGDLAVSLFKRAAGFKDASRMVPGMGGVLDVLDSPLMVAPVAFWILELAV
jgi:phosphatidate cytidylyltransferase